MIALLLATGLAAAEPSALEAAYQKEYAYLVAEKQALEARLAGLDDADAGRVAVAQRDVEGAMGRLLALQRQATELDAQLAAAERKGASEAAGSDALDAVLAQATSTLSIDADGERLDVLRRALAVANENLARPRVQVETGTFFLADGRQVEGRIARAGQVAAWGVSSEGGGPLVPLGAGRLQVHHGADPAAAAAIVDGRAPASAGLLLFESAEKRVDPPAAPTWGDLIEDGGAIGLVILGVGAVLVGLTLWRLAVIVLAGGPDLRGAEQIARLVRDGRIEDARRASAHLRGAVGRMMRSLVGDLGGTREDLEVVAERRLDEEGRRLDRFGTASMVMASISPLLGLLGTVSGMIATFDVITEFGAGNPKLLSGGISEALVTTEFGLVVAIPGVLVGNLLSGRAREILGAVEMSALLLLHEVGRATPTETEDDDDPVTVGGPAPAPIGRLDADARVARA